MSTLDDEIRDSLKVVDATLAGEPVDPARAELAELVLLLADERPVTGPTFARTLDQAVQRRFAPARTPGPHRSGRVRNAMRARWWLWTPAAGLAAALLAAVVIVAGTHGPRSSSGASFGAASSAHRGSSAESQPAGAPAAATNAPRAAAGSAAAPGSPLSGRRTIQGGQLALSAPSGRLEQVAQEVFTVIGQVGGIVENSNVTATGGPGGYAEFQLSIPSSALPQAMASLSTLRYARVASRTDTTQDVTDQYQRDVSSLTDARALRTALLKQLANATTQAQIDSLTARIHDAEASISSDEATLRSLNRQVNYSQVGLTINAGGMPGPVTSSGSAGFGLRQAVHDAGRVLTVAAGIALIGVAVLVPVALVAGLVWWLASIFRRRRREQVLDLV